jgi:hypothetical protein
MVQYFQEMTMKVILLMILSVFVCSLPAKDTNTTKEALKKAMEKEKKYAKEQRFYTADEYNFKDAEVNPKSLDKIEALEPDYDFDMDTGVYDD